MSYRDILRNKFHLRQESNDNYSLRAFARDLGLSSSALSEILNEKKGLSESKAQQLAVNLGLSVDETKLFVDLVLFEHARSPKKREAASERIRICSPRSISRISSEAFSLIYDWYNFAILELTYLKNFRADISWVAKALGISKREAALSQKLLIQVGLLDVANDEWKDVEQDLATTDGTPLMVLKKYHKQLIDKASTALYEQDVDERDITNMLIAIERDDLPEAKKRIREFKKSFINEFGNKKSSDRVYCLGINLFNLTHNLEGEMNEKVN